MRNLFRKTMKKDTLIIRILATMLLLSSAVLLLSQTVFAQTTYVITDGGKVVVHTTYTTDPMLALDEAGLGLDQDDTYTAQSASGVSEIIINRAQSITVEYNGQRMQVASFGETVAELLERLNITLGEDTQISVPLDAYMEDGMVLTVQDSIQQEETYAVPVAFSTEYREDPTLPVGQERVLVPGVDGQKLCTAQVRYENGEEVSRVVISEEYTSMPTTQIVEVGTAEIEVAEGEMPIGGPLPVIGDGIITTATGEVYTYTGTMNVLATAYTKTDAGCDDYTATGTYARVGAIAVDPRMIPYGTRMYIVADDGTYVYGVATAEDCGGSIKGHRIDLYYDTTWECFQFGRRNCTIYFLG